MRNTILIWTIIPITASVSEEQINSRLALLRLPDCLKLKVDYSQSYMVRDFEQYGFWPWPTKPGQITLFNSNSFAIKNAAGLALVNEKTASVSYSPDEALYIIVARIIHEILHIMLADESADHMCTEHAQEFGKYLKETYGDNNAYADNFVKNPVKYEHSIMYEQDFYRYLLLTHFPELFGNLVQTPKTSNRLLRVLANLYDKCISLIKTLMS